MPTGKTNLVPRVSLSCPPERSGRGERPWERGCGKTYRHKTQGKEESSLAALQNIYHAKRPLKRSCKHTLLSPVMFTDRLVISYSTMVAWGKLNHRPKGDDFFRKAKLSDEAGNVTPTDIAFCGCRMRVRSVNSMTALGYVRLCIRSISRFALCMVNILKCGQT